MQSNIIRYIILLSLTITCGVLSFTNIVSAQSAFPLRNNVIFLQLADSLALKARAILPNNINVISIQQNSSCSEDIRNALWRVQSDIALSDSAVHRLESISCNIQYLPLKTPEGDNSYDFFVRECRISAYFTTKRENTTTGQPLESSFRDTIRKEEISLLQEFAPDYARATVPTAPSTFWDDVLSPIVFIAATAVTTVLLFTSRSR